MTRTNLKLDPFVASNWVFKVCPITLYFFQKTSLLARRWRPSIILFTALILVLFCAVNAAGQLSIVVMEKNKRKVPLPTWDVTRILATRGPAQQITVIPMSLNEGEVLIGNTGAVAVRVRCYSAEVSISGKFRVRILPSSARVCNLLFEGSAGARINTTASGPTKVVSGALTLGTSRTRYEGEIPAGKRSFLDFLLSRPSTPIAKVYEGEAVVQSPFFSGAIQEGQKLVPGGQGANAIQRIAPEDYLRSAEIYARLDVSQANVTNERELEAAYLKLLGLHRDVLEYPRDPSKLPALIRAQEILGVPVGDPGAQQPHQLYEVTLKPNEKRVEKFAVEGGCRSGITTWRLTLNGPSFVRLVSAGDVVISPNGRHDWKLEFDATGLKPGTYTGEIKIICVDCPNECSYPPIIYRLVLSVL